MKRLFNRRSNMWNHEVRSLAEELLELTEERTHKAYKIEGMMDILRDYNIYKPEDRGNSNALWRLSAPLYYLTGFICFIVLSPILYIFNIDLMESNFYHRMRQWEKKL